VRGAQGDKEPRTALGMICCGRGLLTSRLRMTLSLTLRTDEVRTEAGLALIAVVGISTAKSAREFPYQKRDKGNGVWYCSPVL
jgi:hypothetical protein